MPDKLPHWGAAILGSTRMGDLEHVDIVED